MMNKERRLTEFGKALMHLLVDRDLSVTEFAKRLGTTAKTINPVIYGEKVVSTELINAVIDTLQLKEADELVLIDKAYSDMNVLEIRTSALSDAQKELAILIVQKIEMLSDAKAKQMIDAISNTDALSELVKEGEAMGEYAA